MRRRSGLLRSGRSASGRRLLAVLCLAAALPACDAAEERAGADGHVGRGREHTEGEAAHPAGEERTLDFSAEAFEKLGVRFATAGPGPVDLGFEVPGEIEPDPQRIAAIGPRFPGIVRSVSRRVGDRVSRGDVLAVVESENLSSFEIRSGIAGTVLEQHAAPGEAIGRERTAFVVGDLRTVWAVLAIYPQDAPRVRAGQKVSVRAPGVPAVDGEIEYLSPTVDPHTRAARARVVLPNEDGRWRPGLFVTATVLEPLEAPVVVPVTAVQTVDGRPVVFARSQGRIEPREVTLGRRGRRRVAVVAGLEPGTEVAHEGVFVLKAELEKGEGGGHHHH
ncbi:MAG: efflux RND transporter periplasmic adaptor subunit [Myxococcota bacterium]